MLKKRVVGVVGLGHVGAHVAFCLGMMGIADEIRLCDLKESKVISECQDLNDAVMYMPNHSVYKIADYAGLADCDIIVNAVGDITLCATGNRDDELENSVRQVADYVPKVMAAGFKGIFISITNPCDVIAHLIQKLSGLPRGRVMGTGTLLDSSRLIHAISDQTGLDSRGFFAFMLGEHGASQIVPWSLINFYGKSLKDMEEDPRFVFDKDKVQETAIKGGWVTYSGKFCTEYGIASAAATLVRTVLHDEKR
ncbi:MAG TPA: L-lactate dehydrogenase, partial [Dialister sp.]|nr:L-lactate dehydrogenase [Dialister sp.]